MPVLAKELAINAVCRENGGKGRYFFFHYQASCFIPKCGGAGLKIRISLEESHGEELRASIFWKRSCSLELIRALRELKKNSEGIWEAGRNLAVRFLEGFAPAGGR